MREAEPGGRSAIHSGGTMTKLSMEIGGMSCGHCVRSVAKALTEMAGVEVEEVQVGSAVVRFDPAEVAPAQIAQAVEAEGYAVLAAR